MLSGHESINRCSRHINIIYHFVSNDVEGGYIVLKDSPTISMVADIMTKLVGRVKFENLRFHCGLCRPRMFRKI